MPVDERQTFGKEIIAWIEPKIDPVEDSAENGYHREMRGMGAER